MGLLRLTLKGDKGAKTILRIPDGDSMSPAQIQDIVKQRLPDVEQASGVQLVDRAKEWGASDTPWWHGSTNDVTAFDTSRATGESAWQLPIDDSFKEIIKGDISDYKNFSGRDGSTITAAALLGEFVGSTPWVHVDIAGTFWAQNATVSYQSKGATGFGVDLILAYLESLAAAKTK
jgi:hypothetical protein